MSTVVTQKTRDSNGSAGATGAPGLRELFDQIERWYAEATNSGLRQTLEIKLFAAEYTVHQVDVIPSTTYRGKVLNNRGD